MEKDKHLGLRIDSETHAKLKSLAEFDGRSINSEVLYLIRQAIAPWNIKIGKKIYRLKRFFTPFQAVVFILLPFYTDTIGDPYRFHALPAGAVQD